MNGRERLRVYLEQRRALGESDLVLDSLSVDDVLAILTDRRNPAVPTRSPATPPHVAEGNASDWRTALRATGAAPETPPPERTQVSAAASATAPDSFTLPREIDTLEAVAQHIAQCTRCGLYATATHPVPGEGNPHAGLMCVGEAPGATEDETGRPFVGAAGQLLTKILEAVQLTREDVFICNVLKHRPPGNRNPLPDEVRACSPYLVRQIELIQPRVILALGTFAAQTLLDTTLPLGKLRGQIHQYRGVPLVVTYHPAALLRNPAWKRPTWEDVQLARRILDSAVNGA